MPSTPDADNGPMSAVTARPRTLPADRLATANAWMLALTVAGVGAVMVAATAATNADYNVHYAVSADNAGPAIQALAHGDLAGAFARQPAMGMLSLLLRAPFARLAETLGGGQALVYRLGVLVSIAPVTVLAAWVAVRGHAQRTLAAGVIAGGLLLAAWPDTAAVGWGHPEELLAATLAVVALLVADRGHAAASGALVGAAVGTKAWAAIAVLPVLLMLDRERLKAVAALAVTAFVLAGIPALANPAAFARAGHALGSSRLVTAFSAWWPVGGVAHAGQAGEPLVRTLPFHFTKSVALGLGLGIALAGALALSWFALRRGGWLRSRGRRVDAFALLCMLALVRCIADPGPVEYYFAAALVPLAIWEATALRRLPVAALLLVAVLRLQFGAAPQLGPGIESGITLCFGGAMVAYLAAYAFLLGRPTPAGPRSIGGR
jgi:hypothetical protein